MPRIPVRSTGARRTVRWMELLAAAQWTFERLRELWGALDQHERDELLRLLERSRGRPDNLTKDQQRRVRVLAMKAWRRSRR